jgi:hypothetical protein
MKNFIILLVILTSVSLDAKPKRLESFNEIYNVLKSGEKVRVIIEYAKCKLIADNEETTAPDAVGGMDINNFEYFAPKSIKNDKAFISTSQTVLINHPKYGYVYNYVKLKFDEENKVKITAQYVDPKTYEAKMDENFFTNINDLDGKKSGISFIINE